MPSITSISPDKFDSGKSVTLSGSGFGTAQGSVSIAGQAQTVTSWSDTSVTFTTVRGSQSQGSCRVDVVPATGYAWAFEGLETGLAGLSVIENHGTVSWDAGGFARLTYTSQGQTAVQYSVPTGKNAICVQYEVRKNTGLKSSKMLKIPSRGLFISPYTKYSNVTAFGGGYTSNTIRLTGYSDHSNGGDTDLAVRTTGTNTGSYTRSTPTFVVTQGAEATYDTSGAVWHKMKLWAKFNSDNTADGEFAIWKDDTLILHMTNVWNCATTIGDGTNAGVSAGDLYLYQERGKVSIGDYANEGGFYEDYRNLKVGYNRPGDLA